MIVLNAADPEGILPVIEKAKRADIVIIAVDVDAAGADVTVISDNFQAGQAACGYLAERLNGRGDVVIINGPPVSSTIQRVAGCKSVLNDYPAIRILSEDRNSGGSRAGGLAVMTGLLLAYPEIDAVFAINDPTALGADLAARYAGRREFFIVSVDGAPGVEQALKDADSLLAATAAQEPRVMAMRGVEIGYRLLNGVEPERDRILIPTPLITRENVDEYEGWMSEYGAIRVASKSRNQPSLAFSTNLTDAKGFRRTASRWQVSTITGHVVIRSSFRPRLTVRARAWKRSRGLASASQ